MRRAHLGEVALEKNPNNEFHRETTKVWHPMTSSPLSSDAVREITVNITGFFETLLKWDEADRRAHITDTSGQAETVDGQTPIP